MPTGKQQDEKWMGGQLKDACLGCSLIYVRAAICGRLDSEVEVRRSLFSGPEHRESCKNQSWEENLI